MRNLLVTFVMVTAAMTVGCDVSQPNPDKVFFAIDPCAPPSAADAPSEHALRISDVRISQPYGDQTFVYKVGADKYQFDYYHGFITSPGNLLTSHLVAWLAGSGQFASVFAGGSSATYRLVLEGNVTELYGDFTADAEPHAVLAAKFFLLDDRPPGAKVLMQKAYRQSVVLGSPTADALAAGWGQAYRRILTELAADLKNVQVPDG